MKSKLKQIKLNFELAYAIYRREIDAKTKGMYIGKFWYILNPLFMLLTYTFIFGVVFQAKWNGTGSTKEYALQIFTGLLVFNLMSDVVSKSCGLISGNPNYTKKIVFPLKVLSVSCLLVSLNGFFWSLTIWLLGYLMAGKTPDVTWAYLPISLVPYCICIYGLSLICASFGAYLKDLGQLMGMVLTLLLYGSPVFYSKEMVPSKMVWLIDINPVAYYIENLRNVLMGNYTFDLIGYMTSIIASVLFFLAANFVFDRLKSGFSDVV